MVLEGISIDEGEEYVEHREKKNRNIVIHSLLCPPHHITPTSYPPHHTIIPTYLPIDRRAKVNHRAPGGSSVTPSQAIALALLLPPSPLARPEVV